MNTWIRAAACSAAIFACAGAQANLISNGDFEAGVLTGWSTYTTVNGNLALATVTTFDVTGAGSSQAATLRAGRVSGVAARAGGGIAQSFTSTGGLVTFSADVAALRDATFGANGDAGLFELIVDGTVLDTVDFGAITTGTVRDALAASAQLTAGLHELRLQLRRDFSPAQDVFGYFDNVLVNEQAGTVPEPASFALALLALGSAAAAGRRSRH